jgi:hypothetical protein
MAPVSLKLPLPSGNFFFFFRLSPSARQLQPVCCTVRGNLRLDVSKAETICPGLKTPQMTTLVHW